MNSYSFSSNCSRGGYSGYSRGGYSGDNRGGYSGNNRRGYDNRGGYSGNNRRGYDNRGGYSGDNRGGYSGDNRGGYSGDKKWWLQGCGLQKPSKKLQILLNQPLRRVTLKNRGGYSGDNRGGYSGDNIGGYSGDDRSGYSGDNRGGYSGDDRSGYSGDNKGGCSGDNKGGYSGDNKGGYSHNNRGGYSGKDRGGYSGYNGGGYSNNSEGGYGSNHRGGFSGNSGGGYSGDNGGGYGSNRRGGYSNSYTRENNANNFGGSNESDYIGLGRNSEGNYSCDKREYSVFGEGYSNSDRDGYNIGNTEPCDDTEPSDGSGGQRKVPESLEKNFTDCLEEGSIIKVKHEEGKRPKYQCLHCKITFFNHDHIQKGGHRGHVSHCADLKSCFQSPVGKKGFGLNFKKVEIHKSETLNADQIKTDPDQEYMEQKIIKKEPESLTQEALNHPGQSSNIKQEIKAEPELLKQEKIVKDKDTNYLAELAPAHARKLIRYYIEAIDKSVEQNIPISMLEIAENTNTINKIMTLKDLFLELGELCNQSTNPDGSVDVHVKNKQIKLDPESVGKINKFGVQSLAVALPKTREERLRWRLPGSWNVKPHDLGEKWTFKHDSLLVVAALEYAQNWTNLAKDEEFGLGYKVLDEEGIVKDDIKSRQEYVENLVNFRGNYKEEDIEVGKTLLWRKNMNEVEQKRENKRKFQSETNQGFGHKKFFTGSGRQ